MTDNAPARPNLLARFLNTVEQIGNRLPHPASLFAICAVLVLLFSAIGAALGWSAVHPATKETITVTNLLSVAGIHRIILEAVTNFTGFAPLGIVLVAMLGIGVAEYSGLINSSIRLIVQNAPPKLLTFTIVLAGILSNIASDAGYVLLIPLAGVIFAAAGRHPIAGMVAAFAGVSGGFSANLMISTLDPMLSGLSQEAAAIIDPNYRVLPTANYYFMIVSTFAISITGTLISEKIVEPRLGKPSDDHAAEKMERLSAAEKRGLLFAAVVTVLFIATILAGIVPADGILRGPNGSIIHSPAISGIITLIFLLFFLAGIAYGIGSGAIRSDADVVKGMEKSMHSMALYIVLAFFAAQFVAYFKWSDLGVIIAVNGASVLMGAQMGTIPLVILFVLLAAFFNLFVGSASAKWAILAPIFVPIFMLIGLSPELSQAVYRIGDSVTNIISPMMSYFALIIAFIQKYDPRSGIGTIVSHMLPYSIGFFIVWTLLLIVWILFDIPLGPGASLLYTAP